MKQFYSSPMVEIAKFDCDVVLASNDNFVDLDWTTGGNV